MERKNYLGLGIVIAIFAALVSLMCIAFSYADVNELNATENAEGEQIEAVVGGEDQSEATEESEKEAVDPEASGEAEEAAVDEDVNVDPVISFKGLSDDYVISIWDGSTSRTTTEKSFSLTGIESDNYSVNGWVWGGTEYLLNVSYNDSSGEKYFQFSIDTMQGYLISATLSQSGDVPKTTNTDVTFSFTKIENPKYYIKVIGLGSDGTSPLEGVDFWYMSNDGTIFPTVSTVMNEAGTEASVKFEVPADKLNGYYDVSYSKLEPNTVYEDDIDNLEYSEFTWDEAAQEFVYEHYFHLDDRSLSTLLLTSDGNINYFQIQMTRDGNIFTYCTPRISYNLGGGAPWKMSVTCNVFDGGDVTCVIDNEHVKMNIPCKVFAKDGYVFDRWETGGASYKANTSFIIEDLSELTIGKIYFSKATTEIAQTGDAIPYAVVIGLGLVAVVAFVVARKQYNK